MNALMEREMEEPLTRAERLRRVVRLCCAFIRNLEYYRVGFPGEPRSADREFWLTVNGNFIDQCILEWFKLMGDPNDDHRCLKVVTDPARFKAE